MSGAAVASAGDKLPLARLCTGQVRARMEGEREREGQCERDIE